MNTLPQNQNNLLEQYKRHLLLNKTSVHALVYVRQFLSYLNDYGIDTVHVRVGDAEKYQGHLITKRDEEGKLVYSSKSVINAMGRLTSLYEYLIKKGQVPYNPFKEIKRIKPGKSLPRNILDEDKLSILLEGLKNKIKTGKDLPERRRFYRWHVLAELMYATGARINEIVKLKVEDLDLIRGIVTLKDSKTGKERYAFLNSYVCEILELYIKNKNLLAFHKSNTELLFNGHASVCKSFNRDVRALSEELGLGNFKSHNLRHSFGFHMLRAGCDIRYIQEFLGHTRLITTQVYTKIEKHDLKKILDTYHPRVLHHERP